MVCRSQRPGEEEEEEDVVVVVVKQDEMIRQGRWDTD